MLCLLQWCCWCEQGGCLPFDARWCVQLPGKLLCAGWVGVTVVHSLRQRSGCNVVLTLHGAAVQQHGPAPDVLSHLYLRTPADAGCCLKRN